jgi:hypothetical protein
VQKEKWDVRKENENRKCKKRDGECPFGKAFLSKKRF